MKRRVRVSAVADRQIERAREWWRRNRAEAPDLFEREFESAIQAIAEVPFAIQRVAYPARDDVRGYLMPVTHYRIFFVVSDDDGTVMIVRVRHARRRPLR